MSAFHEFEHGFWDSTGPEYDEGFGAVTSQIIDPAIKKLGLSKDDLLLDIACGPGYVTKQLEKTEVAVTGIDFSSRMISLAKERNPSGDFRVADAQNLPFENDSFDGVCINFGMLHFANPEAVLCEVHRVLKQGGRMVYAVWSTIDNGSGLGLIMNAIQNVGATTQSLPEAPPFFRFADVDEASSALQQAGLSNLDFEPIEIVWPVQSADFYVEKFEKGGARVGKILRDQDKETYGKIVEHVRNDLKKYPQDQDGVFSIPTPILLASAQKSHAS